PAYAALALLIAMSARSGKARRAPVWVTGSAADPSAVQYRPSAYSNPMRVVLRGPLGYRTRLVQTSGDESERPSFVVENGVVLAIDRFIYAPLSLAALGIAARVRALQSGRLSAYLLYMLIALIGALSLVPILR
ncbi:MAG TPA: hypothetical protein VIJ20_07705, partial [Solirubrobacteraceae bacterium]